MFSSSLDHTHKGYFVYKLGLHAILASSENFLLALSKQKKGEINNMVKPHDLLVPVSYNTLLYLHSRPINQIFSLGSLVVLKTKGCLILRGASHLDAFSGYPVRT